MEGSLILIFALAVKGFALTTLENCGISEIDLDGDRIVGGRSAVLEEFPWQISLKFTNIFIPPTHLCGGTILNERWIITAAHCVYRRSSKNFRVAVGVNNLDDKSYEPYAVEKIRVHEGFDPGTFLNDIAVIRLKRPLILSKRVNGICLPSLEQNVTGFATSTGWGATIEEGDMSNTLQAVELPLAPQSICEIIFGKENFSSSEMICAGDPDGGIDTCQGDSGGPLIQRQNGKAFLIGVVSWGVGCARPGLPGVYTRVSHYIVTKSEENPSLEGCGVSKTSASNNKIVGGRLAIPGEFPWQLSFQMRPLPMVTEYKHICGASVINEKFAVTAAHCIAGGYFTTYQVAAGAQNVTSTKTLPTVHRAYPIVHELYNPATSLKNDIALLRLRNPIEISKSDGFVNGICLPSKELADNVTGVGTVTGWGHTSQGGNLSETLRAVDLPILNDTVCQQAYGDKYENTMLCAGYMEGGKDSCQGDSGGPFVQRGPNGVSTLLGIVSFGKGCAQPNYPGAYTEVAHYMDWIVRTMKRYETIPGFP